MPKFQIINKTSDIKLNNTWVPATKFNSKDKIVDEIGDSVSSNYKGRLYKIVEKRVHTFSSMERVGRGFLGTLAVACSLFLALFSKSVRNLFTKSKEKIRFAILEEETRFKIHDGKVVYLSPKLLFQGAKISEGQELNFALITNAGKQKLVPVVCSNFDRECVPYEGSALEALFKLAQDNEPKYHFSLGCHFGSPIAHFLKHPNNSFITEGEFFKFILEQDEKGTPRICTLNYYSTLEALEFIKEKNIPINLNAKTAYGKTLFTLWAGRGYQKITKLLLEIDPSVIEQIQGLERSPFVEAALKSSKTEADLLLNAIEARNIILTPEEAWIKKAVTNDCAFSEEEFNNLDHELKIKIFYVANAFASVDLVKKLKTLGMEEAPLFWPGPDIFANNMDLVTARNVMKSFLKGLKKEGLLLTHEEFSKLDKTKYISKIDQIGRIQGKNFIERLVKENGLKHIKVPKKIAVINKGLDTISFRIARSLELMPKEDQLTIYAERVKPVKRKLSLEEAIEFMIILEKTGYGDFFGQNFFFAEDGIYFIDTEHKDFSPINPEFGAIESIKNVLDPKDVEQFLAEFEKRKKAYDEEKELREAQVKAYRKAFKNPYNKLAAGYANHEFIFQLESL